jgi:hypothetical protein
LIEETFPMKCPPEEWRAFLEASRDVAQGWLGIYWSLSPQDIAGSRDTALGLLRQQFEILQKLNPGR